MSDLVDNRHLTSGQIWLRRAGAAAAILALVALILWAGMRLSRGSKSPHHQVAKIALLPDTPPPPPPPPPEKPKIEPKVENKQQLEKKQDVPPEPQVVKMEGAAGEGPSPFAAGEVKNDYIGGDIGNGSGELFANYAGHVAQFLQEELTRRKVKVGSARVVLWLSAEGGIQRYEIKGTPPPEDEKQVRAFMAEVHRVPDLPPQGMPMPFGLEISTR